MKIYKPTSSEKYAIIEGANDEAIDLFTINFSVPSVETWPEPELIIPRDGYNEKLELADITFTSAFPKIFSEHAVKVLDEHLTNAGILLPLTIKGVKSKYYYFHCTKEVDCLDVENSKTVPDFVNNDPNVFSAIIEACFFEDKVTSSIFRVPQVKLNHTIYFTDEVVDIIKKNKLMGADFRLMKTTQ